jgi:hypothetical protein
MRHDFEDICCVEEWRWNQGWRLFPFGSAAASRALAASLPALKVSQLSPTIRNHHNQQNVCMLFNVVNVRRGFVPVKGRST